MDHISYQRNLMAHVAAFFDKGFQELCKILQWSFAIKCGLNVMMLRHFPICMSSMPLLPGDELDMVDQPDAPPPISRFVEYCLFLMGENEWCPLFRKLQLSQLRIQIFDCPLQLQKCMKHLAFLELFWNLFFDAIKNSLRWSK